MAIPPDDVGRGSWTMHWLLVVSLATLLVLLLYWLLILTEGTYLGARVVAFLYNMVARRYDTIKGFETNLEDAFITRPLLYALRDRPAPLVLDVATGTGRIPFLLLKSPVFNGRVVGLDYARKMLERAAEKTAGYPDRVVYVWQNAMQLPFPDNSFDLVTCLEALEFMPRPYRVLEELVRVVLPGGIVFTTLRRGWESKVMPWKSWSESSFVSLLDSAGLREVQVGSWQVDYSLVWGIKPILRYTGAQTVPEAEARGWQESLFRCPACGMQTLRKDSSALRCETCDSSYAVASDGIIELAGYYAVKRRE